MPKIKHLPARCSALILALAFVLPGLRAADSLLPVGVAAVDITPDYPVRLNGFGYRRAESEGVTARIWAKALVIADEKEGPAVLITTDNLCVSDEITKEVAERLRPKIGLKLERLTVTATHTHTAPMLAGVAPTIFGTNIPPEHLAHIEQYTREFKDKLVQVAEQAFQNVRPAQLSRGIGEVKFAINRRTPGGPVDHDLSALFVRSPSGEIRAVYFSYACHCVTLGHNLISGDWSGYAQAAVQKMFPGAVALASVGCGADSNPNARGSATNLVPAIQQGQEVADEIKRLAGTELRPVSAPPLIRYDRVDLPLDTPRTREEWEKRTQSEPYAVVYHARLNLERLARGETLPTTLNYPIQTWLFGDQLAMLFLPGETVVDYSLRLKREYDRSRLWINGYSNDGRCYIPSERILREGGYEGGDAMIYYDRPQRFAPGVEQRIFNVLTQQLPKSFSTATRTEGVPPKTPAESLGSIRTRPGLAVELVAAEPLVVDPVAIDWAADGRLWVCEMNDYPAGLDGNWQPGGRIKILEDTDGDGRYDKATLFLENVPFPTGVTCWGKGVLICAAPDILYAEDTDGDGKADRVEKVFSGFFTDNFQARINSLQLGLDNWFYGANGLLGGTILTHPGRFPRVGREPEAPSVEVNIRNHDVRFSPFTAAFETATGLSQQGRVRDDWGNWFGCDNSNLLFLFGLPDHYLRRNPHVAFASPIRNLASRPDGNRLYPSSRLLERFNDLDQANRTTSACGLAIYRDTLLGGEYEGNAFTCEVVHNLVHREILHSDGGVISSTRAPDESNSEFLSSTDNWFRPAQARTGPDGALYVVDMYRFLIEHPRWIPAARLARIDVRSGSDMGRIYRVRPEGRPLRPIRNLGSLDAAQLAAAMDSPNGTERDRVQSELLHRQSPEAAPELKRLVQSATLPQVRAQALCALDGIRQIASETLTVALHDSDPRVRAQAIRISEPLLRKGPEGGLAGAVLALTADRARPVREQLALTLGEWNDPRAGEALARLTTESVEQSDIRQAVLTSAHAHCPALLKAVAELPENARGRSAWIAPLVATAAASPEEGMLARAFALVANSGDFAAYGRLLQALDRQGATLSGFLQQNPSLSAQKAEIEALIQSARNEAADGSLPGPRREAALALFERKLDSAADISFLAALASKDAEEGVRSAALAALRRQSTEAVAAELLQLWPQTPLPARPPIVSLLLSREAWAAQFLEALNSGRISPREIGLADQEQALRHPSPRVREMAGRAFKHEERASRESVLAQYSGVSSLTGSSGRGAELFAETCASCHRIGSVGAAVGPNLAALGNKDADYWVKNILDPNAVVEPRFVAYDIELADERSLTGIIQAETPNNVVVAQGGGAIETLARNAIKSIRPARLSLMPEGLESALPPARMADLIAFLRAGDASRPSSPASRGAPELVLRDPASVARLILDGSQPDELRQTAIQSNPQFAADLIREMTRDLPAGDPEEYARIPWLWRVAIAAGKRNDSQQLKRILDLALPRPGEPLRDWEAVIIGGGLINGWSQRGVWPRTRLAELLNDASLEARWTLCVQSAALMADNERVPAGPRYDALRILGASHWTAAGALLTKHLQNSNAELQMGAVSALSDIDAPESAKVLLAGLKSFTQKNQTLAIAGLLRTPERRAALRAAIEAKSVSLTALSADQQKLLAN